MEWPRPARLLRYLPKEASDFFIAKKLWFSTVLDFNDPFEVRPRFDALLKQPFSDEALLKRFSFLPPDARVDWFTFQRDVARFGEEMYRQNIDSMPDDLQESFAKEFGIVCFSEILSSLLMWGHYASSHQGFVVEFDHNQPVFGPQRLGMVEYPPSKQRPSANEPQYWRLLLTKSAEWKYEAEFRLIMPRSVLQVSERRDKKKKWCVDLPPETVRAVYFGCRMQEETQEELVTSLKSPEWKHVRKFRMKLHPTEFALSPEEFG